MSIQIAIDGPVAAGKGTVSKLLAEKLNILYVDTGAMYRALAYFVKNQGIDYQDEPKVCASLKKYKPEVHLESPVAEKKDGRLVTVLLNGKDISWAIRTEEISHGVSVITQYKCVRQYMVPQQQALASKVSVIMEGRDITFKVLPNANLRIYLDANEDIRAQRRYKQYLEKGESTTLEQVKKDIRDRDYRDMHRKLDPLQIVDGVWHLDTSEIDIPEVVDKIYQELIKLKII